MATMTNDMAFGGSNQAAIVEAETYEPTVAPRVVTLSQPHHAATEQYRVLRYRLECLAKAGIKALAFTSPQSGEGKTTTAVNAALTLGKGGRNRVVLVDADLRRPGVASMLGLRATKGLADVVMGARRSTTACGASAPTSCTSCRPATCPTICRACCTTRAWVTSWRRSSSASTS